MNFRFANLILVFSFVFAFSGCNLVEAFFKAGVWFTILGILVVIALLYLIFGMMGKKPEKNSNIIYGKREMP